LISRLVLENLKHRKTRTALSALSIGFQVTMILAVVGLSRGMLQDSIQRARGVNADIWVKPPGASVISFSSAGLPEKLLDGYFRKQPHVRFAAGSLIHPIGGISTMAGIRLEEFSQMSGGFRFVSGGPFRGPDDLIVDEYYARQSKKKVGDKVVLANHTWTICGIVEPGKLGRLFVSLPRLQELTGNTGKLSQVFLKLDDPARTEEVIQAMKKELEGYQINSLEELISMFSVSNVPGLRAFIYVIIGLAIIIGFLVVSLTMYTTVLERTREIGILKALGAAPADIMGILLRETIVLALVGWLAGLGLSLLVNWVINRFVQANLQSVLTPDWWPIVLAIALGASLLGALYPGLRAARQDAIEALAYE
jgi:putative ABC transport system permease protein